jgi:hypothetical protein
MGCDITVKRSTIAELALPVLAPTVGATLRTQCTTKLAAKRERDVASICGSSRGCASDDEGKDCQQCGAAGHQCTHRVNVNVTRVNLECFDLAAAKVHSHQQEVIFVDFSI